MQLHSDHLELVITPPFACHQLINVNGRGEESACRMCWRMQVSYDSGMGLLLLGGFGLSELLC